MNLAELNEKANTYFDLLAQIDELTAQAEAIKGALKSVMVDRSTEALDGTGWRATWHNTQTTRFDSKRFKVDHAGLYTAYTIKGTSTRFTLNRLNA